jgi:hypothetical protein
MKHSQGRYVFSLDSTEILQKKKLDVRECLLPLVSRDLGENWASALTSDMLASPPCYYYRLQVINNVWSLSIRRCHNVHTKLSTVDEAVQKLKRTRTHAHHTQSHAGAERRYQKPNKCSEISGLKLHGVSLRPSASSLNILPDGKVSSVRAVARLLAYWLGFSHARRNTYSVNTNNTYVKVSENK